MTPNGDAIRIWSAVVVATVAYVALFQTVSFVVFNLGFLNAMIVTLLLLTMIAMYRCTPGELKKWAVYQSEP